MKTKEMVWSGIAVLAVIAIAYAIFFAPRSTTTNPATATIPYACDNGKSIAAQYYEGGSVRLAFADGRMMALNQAISADGARYATDDESFVFWSKGNGALVLENGKESTYTNCISVLPDPGTLPLVYHNGPGKITVRYPSDFIFNDSYQYLNLGPGKEIPGVKFTIPKSLTTGTNLADDSYVSIEEIGNSKTCSAAQFLDGVKAQDVTDGDMTYSVASSTGAGAGNRYEETVYALPYSNPCVGIRYFIHYGVIDNYPAGTTKEFDKAALVKIFDSVRRTLTVNQSPGDVLTK